MDTGFVAINVAYFFYVLATIPKQIVPLRVLLIIASAAFIIFGLIDDNLSVIVWNVLFIFPQLFQLTREIRSQRLAVLTPEEEALRTDRFSSMSARSFLMFWSVGEERITDREELITQNESNQALLLILDGVATVTIDGRHAADRGPGNLLGEASFVTGDPASATVSMPAGSRVRVWPHDKLDALSRAQPDVSAALLSTFVRELSLKMKSASS